MNFMTNLIVIMKKVLITFILLNSILFFGQQKKIDSLISVLEKTKEIKEKISVLDVLNPLLIQSNKPNESIRYFELMAFLSKKLNDYDKEAKSYRYLSESYMRKQNRERAILFAEKSIQTDKNLKNTVGLVLGLNQLGRVYHHFQNYKKAIETYKEAINLAKRTPISDKISIVYGNLGVAYNRLDKKNEEINCYIKQAKYADLENDITQKSNAFYNLANAYMYLEQYKKAETYFFKALKDSSEVILKTYVYRNYHGLGINYSRWGKYKKALEYNKKALNCFKKSGEKLFVFDVLNNTAVVYLRMEKPLIAIKYAKKALKIAKEINHKLAIAGAKSTLINSYIELKRYQQAEILLKDIVKDTVNPKIINRESKVDILENFYLVYKGQKNYKKALHYFEIFNAEYDSILREQRDSKINELESKYQNEKKEKELIQKREELYREKTKNQRNKLYLIILSILLFISFGYVLYVYRLRKKSKRDLKKARAEIKNIQKNDDHILFDNTKFKEFAMSKYGITKNELYEVWESIANGDSLKEYVDRTNFNKNTVKKWRIELYQKLKGHTKGRFNDAKATTEYYKTLISYKNLSLNNILKK